MKSFVMLLLLLCLATWGFSQSKGGRWEFENNGDDTAAWDLADNPGALQNQAGFADLPPLQQGSAYLWLDTTSTHNFLKVEDSDDLDFDDENVGISAWIYPVVLNDVHYLVNKGEQSKNPKTTNYSLRIAMNSNQLEFLIRDANNQAQVVSSSFTITENTWNFVAAYYDFSAGKVYMWNDPAQPPVDTLNFNQSLFGNSEPLAIGSWYRDDPANPSIKDFKGRMDDVRISGRMEDIIPSASGLERPDELIPGTFSLHQNYPNPFNPATRIAFDIEKAARVRLTVYNLAGQEVAMLVDQYLTPGRYQAGFDAGSLVSGVYFYRLSNGADQQTRKMLLVR